MKFFSPYILITSFLVAGLMSCTKDENKIFFEGGTPPALTANATGTIPLSFANSDQEAITLKWTNPNYRFTTGVSSQDVSYLVEIDRAGANFASTSKQTVAVSQDLSLTLTQAKMNDYLLNQLVLTPGVASDIEIRVIASLNNRAVPLISNVLKFRVTPYAIPPKVEPPTAGTLWMTGDAAPSSWANPLPNPYDNTQKFTRISNTLYELTIALPGGGGYKLIQEQGNWGSQYHMLPGGTWEGGDFEKRDADPQFPGPPSAGNYKITVDFQRGKFFVVKL